MPELPASEIPYAPYPSRINVVLWRDNPVVPAIRSGVGTQERRWRLSRELCAVGKQLNNRFISLCRTSISGDRGYHGTPEVRLSTYLVSKKCYAPIQFVVYSWNGFRTRHKLCSVSLFIPIWGLPAHKVAYQCVACKCFHIIRIYDLYSFILYSSNITLYYIGVYHIVPYLVWEVKRHKCFIIIWSPFVRAVILLL